MNMSFPLRASEAPPSPRLFISELASRIGERVTLCGWVTAVRCGKDIAFLELSDRSGKIQLVERVADLPLCKPTIQSAVRAVGIVVASPGSRYGEFEVQAQSVEILGLADNPLPPLADAERRFDSRHLDLREPQRRLIFEVQASFLAAAREFLAEEGFLEIHTPKITSGGSESGAAVFHLPYFSEQAYLVQSPQFYVQLAMAAGFDRVFEVGPSFRAEETQTHRHATEFTSLDVELSWIANHHDLMELEERLLRHSLLHVANVHGPAIEREFGARLQLSLEPFPRIDYADALAIAGEAQPDGQGRLSHRAEQALSKYCLERFGQSFVFITDYPSDERSFYTMRECPADRGRDGRTRSFDLLWRGIEITSGCQREHRHGQLCDQMQAAGIEPHILANYLEPFYLPMFRHGCPPHGGFGLGVNRLLMVMLGQSSIAETSFAYRGPRRLRP